jgi:outer membrane protein assembly factor BamD (BamD/ComL family)
MILLTGCAAKVVTYEQQLIGEADSLFKVGNYEYAKVKYARIRNSKPESEWARTAQFMLGYINVYYDNPFANWEAALREFKLFVTAYPTDVRIGEVNSWIRILIVLQSFKKEYDGTATQMEQLKAKDTESNNARRMNVDAITESLRGCYVDRDSLSKKIEDLKNVIIEMERKCQQVGR